MAKSILPFSFCMKGQTSPELEWDDSKFNEFTEQIGPNWKEQDYALTSNDNITYAISLLSNIDNTHLLLKFHSDTLPKVQISKLFWNDFTVNNCQQKIQFIRQESIQAYKAPKNHDDYHQIFLIDEIWDFVNNEEKTLIVFDLDFTLVFDNTAKVGDFWQPDVRLIDENLNDKLDEALKNNSNLTFILISNTANPFFTRKLELVLLRKALFSALLPIKNQSDTSKTERLSTYLHNSAIKYENIIIVDDSAEILRHMHAEAQNRNIKCKTLHFFGAMLAKLERQAELEFPNIEPKIRLETFLDAYPETAEIYLDATGLLLENIIIEPIQQTSSQVDLLDDIIEDLIDVPPESHDDNCTEDEDINRLNSKLRI